MDIIIKNKLVGRTAKMIDDIMPMILVGARVPILGCKEPNRVVELLEQHGVIVEYEPIQVTAPIKLIYNANNYSEEVNGFNNGDKRLIGFIFWRVNKKNKE